MKLIKENSYDVVRLIINQIGISIFSLILYTAVGNLEDEALNMNVKIAVSVFSILFFFALLYTTAWDWGAKDKIRIDSGRLECTGYKGAILSLAANLPNFILAAICSITMGLYMLSGGEALHTISAVCNLFMRIFAAMYLGVLQGVFSFAKENADLYYLLQSVGYFVIPMFAVLTTHIGYSFGRKEKKIFFHARMQNKSKK